MMRRERVESRETRVKSRDWLHCALGVPFLCLSLMGCAWDRSYFHLDSDSQIPFLGFELRWPPSAMREESELKPAKDIDGDDSTAESEKTAARMVVRAQSGR